LIDGTEERGDVADYLSAVFGHRAPTPIGA
jgi:hypothetical protein